jgi:hypothetical protein
MAQEVPPFVVLKIRLSAIAQPVSESVKDTSAIFWVVAMGWVCQFAPPFVVFRRVPFVPHTHPVEELVN